MQRKGATYIVEGGLSPSTFWNEDMTLASSSVSVIVSTKMIIDEARIIRRLASVIQGVARYIILSKCGDGISIVFEMTVESFY